MNLRDGFFSFPAHLVCSVPGRILAMFSLLTLRVHWYIAPWLVLSYAMVVLAFLFVPSPRHWRDEYTPGWDWTRWKR